MLSVKYNPLEMSAMRGIKKSASGLSQTLERLSTGKRMNSPKDDPSGFIAVTLLRSDVAAAQGKLKSNQLLSGKLSVVDSGLSQISTLLNQAKSLVVAAANTGALTDDQISAYQMELDMAIDSIRRLTKMTSFQGEKVLDGLEGLLNGTMTAEQRQTVVGAPRLDSSGRLVESAQSGSKTLGELSDGIVRSLTAVSEIQQSLGIKIVSGLPEHLVASGNAPVKADLSADLQETLLSMVDSWVQDRLEALGVQTGDDQQDFQQQIIQSLYDKALKQIAGSTESATDRSETEWKTIVSENLDSIFNEVMQKEGVPPTPEALAGLALPPLSVEEIAQKFAEIDQAEQEEAEAARLELEELLQKQAEEAQQAAEKAEKEAKAQKREEELEVQKQRAEQMYWLGRKSVARLDLPQDRTVEKSESELAREEIQSLFADRFRKGAVPQAIGYGQNAFDPWAGLHSRHLAENAASDSKSIAEQQKISLIQVLGQQAAEISVQNQSDKKDSQEETNPAETSEETGKKGARTIDDLKSGGIADLRADPEAAGKFLDQMIRDFSFARIVNGIEQRNIDIDNALLTDSIDHNQRLDSLISDADFAEEASNLARHQLLLAVGMNAWKIAQDYPKMVLNLLMQS